MGLVVKAAFSKTTTGIRTKDLTGLYNSDPNDPHYNTTGWENAATGFVAASSAAVLSVSVPDQVTLLPVATPQTFSLYNTLPNYLYASKDIVIAGGDGVYYFTLAITNSAFLTPIKFSQYKLFTPAADCCIQKLSDASVCDAKKKVVFQQAYDIWTTMKYAGCCGDIQKAVTQLKLLQRICKKNGCGCC